jgi:serine/threonine protein kinase
MSATRQYRLVRELGTGTFGTVYQAELASNAGFRKQVAIKVLHPMWAADHDAARRFRDEARLLGQIRHRHIVQVDGLVQVGGRWAVVMEFVPGCDGNVVLRACIEAAQPFPIPAALEVASAVASALDAAYNAHAEDSEPLRVIHRDIKPSNIRLTQDGDVKVLDFGIARSDLEGREAVTRSVRYGSVRYMAPERHQSLPATPPSALVARGWGLLVLRVGKPLGGVEPEWAQHPARVHERVAGVLGHLGKDGAPIVELLQSMVAFRASDRPTAAAVAERTRALARAHPGVDLVTFARCFLPDVHRLVPDTTLPIERVVSEGGDPVHRAESGEVVSPRSVVPSTETATPAWVPWVAAAFLVAVLLVGAVLAWTGH